jgi:hypothetical protein
MLSLDLDLQLCTKFSTTTSKFSILEIQLYMYTQVVGTTVHLTGTKLAHQARAAVARGIS